MSGRLAFTSILLFLVAASTAYSQGTVNFVNLDTSVTPVIDAHIGYGAGGVMPVGLADSGITVTDPATHITYGGSSIRVALYGGPGGTTSWKDLVLITPAVGVGTGAQAGYADSGPNTIRTVTGIAPGKPAVFQLRAWDAGLAPGETTPAQTWDEATLLEKTRSIYRGKSQLLDVAALGGDGLPPAELFGLSSFNLILYGVPEPSVLILGAVCAALSLLLFRRQH